MDFTGKSVLITGGTRGIGRAIVEQFAAAGAHVAFTYRSSADEAAALTGKLGAIGYQADAADFDAAEEVVQDVVAERGCLDVLVNNAGITRDGLLLRMRESDWDLVVQANLKSVFNYSHAAYRPMMRQRSGRIISISSIVGLQGNAGQSNYAASKAGIIGFTKSLAKELGSRGITVNVVAPGYVETDMTSGLPERTRKEVIAVIPLRRTASPEEIAAPVLFLSSSAASYITGQVVTVDGGLAL
ncbi:MAG: 3-oxoacyl-[acyl-carrier-protein] reductase [Bacteroidota bacterium]|nr:3-oxoacyl-[acyl-carrier-protein] reductase [Bacteroidota bacterium]